MSQAKRFLKSSNKFRTSTLLFLCFALPCAVLLLVYYFYGIAPFGDKSLLIMDMSAQYSEFFCGLKHIGAQNGGVLFSWSKVLGGNYAGVFAYYLSSPLSFLTLLCPNDKMPVGLLYLTVLKIGLCGLTFGILLNYLQKKARAAGQHILQNRAYILVFSVLYALMSYNIVYSMCLMWLDAVIWLPIVIIGIEKIVDGENSPLLLIAFTVLFISTYYISYMVGIFACIYFLFAVLRRSRIVVKQALTALAKFASSALFAACAGAWLLLPTLYSLFEGKIDGSIFTAASGSNYTFSDVLQKLFIGTYDSITYNGMPFFYCGILVFLFYFAYYFTKSIRTDEKVMTAAITAFLLLSTYSKKLDLMWHVFQTPNWFPYRYSFILTFFIIYTAVKGFVRIREIPYAVYIAFALIAAAFYRYMMDLPQSGVGEKQFQYSIIFLLAVIGLLFVAVLVNRIHVNRAVNCVLLCLLVAVVANEMYVNARYLTEGLDGAHRYESYEKYQEYKELTEALADEAQTQAKGDFYRIGSDFQRNFNEAIGLGYGGISHYSSSYNKNMNTFLHNLGFAQIYYWSSYAGSTTVTDALFSIKYVMSDPEIERLDDKGKIISWCNVPYTQYLPAAQEDSAVLYENPYVLAPCFAASSRLHEFHWMENSIESQNLLLNCILGDSKSYYIKLSEGQDRCVQLDKTEDEVRYEITLPEDGPLYAYFPKNGNTVRMLSINGSPSVKLYMGETDCIQFLGNYRAGDTVTVSIPRRGADTSGNVFYMLDMDAFTDAVDHLRNGELKITEWSSGSLQGTADVAESGTMFTSLAYDDAWRVCVDGKQVETWALEEGLLCFDIAAGRHEIDIEYHVPGFAAGMTLTVLAVVSAAVFVIVWRIRKRR